MFPLGEQRTSLAKCSECAIVQTSASDCLVVFLGIASTAPILPISCLRGAFLGRIFSLSLLLAVAPETFVFAPIRPAKDTESMFHVRNISPTVFAATWPHVATNAVDHRIFPFSSKATPITGQVHTCAMDDIVRPFALILRAVNPCVASKAILLSLMEQAFIMRPFYPCFCTISILQIIGPLPSICCAALVIVNTHATGHILRPLANVYVTVAVSKASFACRHVLTPLPFKHSSIWPRLFAHSVPH
mmetsp:Transcript_68437/g.107852  ORF Transcript_68437/g.107852 Transcript_68437/m.107852 type:complete len:246 (+) Transcript_68437:28-765(+)